MKTLLAGLVLALVSLPVSAQEFPDLDPSYNHRIIDDSTFTGGFGFTDEHIQDFLETEGGDCEGDLCLKNYRDPETDRSAAEIIHSASRDIGINPQVILVTLQKENSLVTDEEPEEWQYRTAMGYGCPDDADCEADFFGFSNQVYLGANLMRAVYDRACGRYLPHWKWQVDPKWYRGNTVEIDGRPTRLETCATAALYNYTPHRVDSAWREVDGMHYYGNYNFVYFYQQWFDN